LPLGQDARLYGSPEGRRYVGAGVLAKRPRPRIMTKTIQFYFPRFIAHFEQE